MANPIDGSIGYTLSLATSDRDMFADLSTSLSEFSSTLGGISKLLIKSSINSNAIFLKQIEGNIMGSMYGLINSLKAQGDVNPFQPMGSIVYWDKVYSKIHDANKGLGISNNLSLGLRDNIVEALPDAYNIGATEQDLVDSYSDFISETGENRLFSKDELVTLAKIKQNFGSIGKEIFATTSSSGKSIIGTAKMIENVFYSANRYGLNAKSVFEDIEKSVKYINTQAFKGGVEGLTKMALTAERTKLSMDGALGFSEKLWDVDSAMELSNALTLMGGKLGNIGADFYRLMYEGRNDPDALIQRMGEALGEFSAMNKQTGEFEINAMGMQMLRKISEATGLSRAELAEAAKTQNKKEYFSSQLGSGLRSSVDFDAILSKVVSAAQYDTNTGQYSVQTGRGQVGLTQLTKDDINSIESIMSGTQTAMTDNILNNQTFGERIERLIKVLENLVISNNPYLALDKYVKEKMVISPTDIKNTPFGDLTGLRKTLENQEGQIGFARMGFMKDALKLMSDFSISKAVQLFTQGNLTEGLEYGYNGEDANLLMGTSTKGYQEQYQKYKESGKPFDQYIKEIDDQLYSMASQHIDDDSKNKMKSYFEKMDKITSDGTTTDNVREFMKQQNESSRFQNENIKKSDEMNPYGEMKLDVSGSITLQGENGITYTLSKQQMEQVVQNILKGKTRNGGKVSGQ